ncbi:RUS family member 1 isoform X1 [Hydra vulgaris]|uniref:RUS family member 1 isoform X1 n=1 Tax=Hydra vulgaris TaxID=6087 RepID=UPI001F5F0650|nr:RUS family member 1-like [Hydra vulgaris]
MSSKVLCYESYGSNEEKIVYYEDGFCKKTKNLSVIGFYTTLKLLFQNVFLPQGFPESVSEDYLRYQLWDTLQAFCSSITGMLATQAMLKAYGVGDNTATVTAATITWMLKDGAGMIGRILFAWKKGTQLDCDAKRWRLVADVLNNCAIMLDLVAPLFKQYFVLIACLSSVARSIVGVAGGATRAALTLHQARRNNMADVSAKDGSQETLVNLMALFAGFLITPLVVDNLFLTWYFFLVFTFLHLYANYQAVSTVVMETINLPRLHILVKHYFIYGKVLTPKEVNKVDPVLRRPGFKCSVHLGCQYADVLKCDEILDLPGFSLGYNSKTSTIHVSLYKDTSEHEVLQSSFLAMLVDLSLNKNINTSHTKNENLYLYLWENTIATKCYNRVEMERILKNFFPTFINDLKVAGWDLSRCHLGVDEWRVVFADKTQ